MISREMKAPARPAPRPRRSRPALFARERRARVSVMPGFEALVRVLYHHHRGVHHRADGDRMPPRDMMLAFTPW